MFSQDYDLLTLNCYSEQRRRPTTSHDEDDDPTPSIILEIRVHGDGDDGDDSDCLSEVVEVEPAENTTGENDDDVEEDDEAVKKQTQIEKKKKEKWVSDLQKLQSDCHNNLMTKTREITSLTIHPSCSYCSSDGSSNNSKAAGKDGLPLPPPRLVEEIPVRLLTLLFQTIPNLSHFECKDVTIDGTAEEFQEWANALQDLNLTHFTIHHSFLQSATAKESSCCCDKWEPVIVALLTSSNNNSNLQQLRVDWNGKTNEHNDDDDDDDDDAPPESGRFSMETSRLILERMMMMEQQQQQQQQSAIFKTNKIISLNFPLSFHSLEEAAQYYTIKTASQKQQQHQLANQNTAIFHCSSPLQEKSFMRKFFDTHKFPVLPEASIEVISQTGYQSKEDNNNHSDNNNDTAEAAAAANKTPTPQPLPSTQTIFVTVSKKQMANPQGLTSQLQRLLSSSGQQQQQQQQNVIQVKPPLIGNKKKQLELILNPNYLKSQHIYSRFPNDLWDVDFDEFSSSSSSSDSSSSSSHQDQYRRMVTVFVQEEEEEEGGRCCLPPGMKKESISALFDWFSAQPNHLLQIIEPLI